MWEAITWAWRAIGRVSNVRRRLRVSVRRIVWRIAVIIKLAFDFRRRRVIAFEWTIFRRISIISVIIRTTATIAAALMLLIGVHFRAVNCLHVFAKWRRVSVFLYTSRNFAYVRLFVRVRAVLVFCAIGRVRECLWTARKFTHIWLFASVRP